MIYDINTGFYELNEYIDKAFLDWDETDHKDSLKYPIAYLNEALGGMTKSELIVIGADSGTGKTEIVNSIAFDNASRGKNVYLFSLEGDRYEVINRQRYKEYTQMVNSTKRWDLLVSYRDFIQGNMGDKKDKVRDEMLSIDELFKAKYKTLKIYAREESLTMELFASHLELINGKADLVVIDHLHYFDFKSRDEYSEINEIMKQLKTLQDKYRIPIVLVSHLRKKDKTRVFPGQEDFHGSSNIVKQADTCIVLAHIEPGEEDTEHYAKQVNTNIYDTGIRVAKSRSGFSNRLLGIVKYDLNKRKYADDYELAICGNTFVTKIEKDSYPTWSRYAKKNDGTLV